MIKSAFQIPHHVAIRTIVYAPPLCFSAEISGAAEGGIWHCDKKVLKKNKITFEVFRTCAKVEPCSRFVWANSRRVIPPLLILDGPIIIDSRFRLCVSLAR